MSSPSYDAPPLSRSPNFCNAPPQKLKINLIFQRINFCYRQIHVVLFVYHLLILVNIIFFFIPMVGLHYVSLCFFCVCVKTSLNSLDNTAYVLCVLSTFSQKKYSCRKRPQAFSNYVVFMSSECAKNLLCSLFLFILCLFVYFIREKARHSTNISRVQQILWLRTVTSLL